MAPQTLLVVQQSSIALHQRIPIGIGFRSSAFTPSLPSASPSDRKLVARKHGGHRSASSRSPGTRFPASRVSTEAVLYEAADPKQYGTVRRVLERDFGTGYRRLYDAPQRGRPAPLGPSAEETGVNFALASSGAAAVSLCLFSEADLAAGGRVTAEVPLHPVLNRTGEVWHIYLPGLAEGLLYGFRVAGESLAEEGLRFDISKVVVDPYAKAVVSRARYGEPAPGGECWPQMAGMVPCIRDADDFDWEGDRPPRIPQKDLIIYECHVRGFTKHTSSGVIHPGSYLGMVEKLPYLRELGVNALELLPIHEFNELEYYALNPTTKDYKMNFWGYSTINFFAPMSRYASHGSAGCGRTAIREFKTLVRECHKQGMEVILDVVFNHTAEGNEMGPTISFRGIDNRVYYMVAPKGEFYNYSGCGNTFNCNHPVVRRFIIDCLRYWVVEMHIDGFRFDLASILTRASSMWERANAWGSPEAGPEGELTDVATGTPLEEPPLIEMISNDPILRGTKLIAEAWDAGGLYQVGTFPHYNRWGEWNGKFRDEARMFIKGTEGHAGLFAECLCGWPALYKSGGRQPWHSVNFVTCHDGFTLADLVTYNEKSNIANGEENRDGENHNLSWNCGEEGKSTKWEVVNLRQRQMRNFFVALMVSQGTPMIHMGDEYGHTKGGNNNTYCHDSLVNFFQWDAMRLEESGLVRFFKLLARLRLSREALRMSNYPDNRAMQWHGLLPNTPDWSETSKLVAFTVRDDEHGELYVAFNSGHQPVWVTLPQYGAAKWQPLVDTAKPAPYDFLAEDTPGREAIIAQADTFTRTTYPIMAYSSIILTQVPA